jgi:glycosyltransferase involved in cell wall biosynthesis
VNGDRPRLAFVSPLFLFPTDAGGKIRTTNILRGLKGGAFDVTLISPASDKDLGFWSTEIDRLCDRFAWWPQRATRARWRRAFDLLDPLPVNVAIDRSASARRVVRDVIAAGRFDIVVFDFVHATVLRPDCVDAKTVCFTHNVEAEIFQRHAEEARGAPMRAVWASQYRKMQRFEADALRRFSRIVAVSDRDAARFRERYAITETSVIPTGVDLDYFAWQEPPALDSTTPPTVVFTGAMDWAANVDGVRFFIESVWPAVTRHIPTARFVVVGRNPQPALLDLGRATTNVRFTGFVDDVRPYVHDAHVFVIPLRVGGGTRIKAFEAMAMGCPVVSTAIGIEGLDVQDGVHYLCRDGAEDQAAAIVDLLGDAKMRRELSARARECVECRFGHIEVARVFERACLRAMETAGPEAVTVSDAPRVENSLHAGIL